MLTKIKKLFKKKPGSRVVETDHFAETSNKNSISLNDKSLKTPRNETIYRKPNEFQLAPEIHNQQTSNISNSFIEKQDRKTINYKIYEPDDMIEGRYKVEKCLEGGMGYVYIAKDNIQDITFAIKQPKRNILAYPDLFVRVHKEANAWIKLGIHPHIAYCYFVKKVDEVPFIFVEYADAGNLREWIEDGKCVKDKFNLDLAIQFCHGMEHAHGLGMLHRDIKPENILMTATGTIKVTDFGLVGGDVIRGAIPENQSAINGQTEIGTEMGTRDYMSPEQWADPRQKCDDAPDGVWFDSDIFSFGICLWEMFCGAKPYKDYTQVMTKTATQPDPHKYVKTMDKDLCKILIKTVALCRSERYRNFESLRIDLNNLYIMRFGCNAPNFLIKIPNQLADELNNQGYSFFELGYIAETTKCLNKALENDLTHLHATFNLSLIEWRSGTIDDVEVLRRLENCKSNPNVNLLMLNRLIANVHFERMDLESAQGVLSDQPGEFTKTCNGHNFSQIRLVQMLKISGHKENISSFSISADGRKCISGSLDNTLKLWDLETGSCIRTLVGHNSGVRAVSISTDGRKCLSGSSDKTLKLWDLDNGLCVLTLKGHKGDVNAVSMSVDGRRCISSGSTDKSLKLWDLETGQCLHTLKGHTWNVTSVAISNDNTRAISGSDDRTLRYWDLNTGKCISTLAQHTNLVLAVDIGHNGRKAISGSCDNNLKLWDLETGKCVFTFDGHTSHVCSVAISHDGKIAISGCRDGYIKYWCLRTGRCYRTIKMTSEQPTVALSADYSRAVSLAKNVIYIYELAFNEKYKAHFQVSQIKSFDRRKNELEEFSDSFSKALNFYIKHRFEDSSNVLFSMWSKLSFSYNPDIYDLYLKLNKRGRKKEVVFYSKRKLRVVHEDLISATVISSDGKTAISGGHKSLKLWNLQSGSCLRELKKHTLRVKAVAVSMDGQKAVSGGFDETIRVWNLETGENTRVFEGHKWIIYSIDISPDGGKFVSGSGDQTIKYWDLDSGECINTMEGHVGPVNSVAISPDGRKAISGSGDQTIKYWDLDSGECINTMEGHVGPVNSVAISPDGGKAISGSKDQTIKYWDLYSGECINTMEGHGGSVNSVVVSPDGRKAISGSDDKTIGIWDLNSCKNLCNLIGHNESVFNVSISLDQSKFISNGTGEVFTWDIIWNFEFPSKTCWDETLRPYLLRFLKLKENTWDKSDLNKLLDELEDYRGYGWVSTEGIINEIDKMSHFLKRLDIFKQNTCDI